MSETWTEQMLDEVMSDMEAQDETKEPPRLRLAKHIDLSKADPKCDGCKGTGIKGKQIVPVGEDETMEVPVICRCVTQRGGVKPDKLDKILIKAAEDLDRGVFASNLANDIRNLPPEHQAKAIAGIIKQSEDPKKPRKVKEALHETLKMLRSGADDIM